MAAPNCVFPVEVLRAVGNRDDWKDEFERRHTLYRLVLVSRHFNEVFTPILYREFEHSEEDWLFEQHLRSFLFTTAIKPELASHIRKLRIINWCPEVFFDPRNPLDLFSHTYNLVNELVSRAYNVSELQIRLPHLPILNHKPFLQLKKLHLFAFVPYTRGRTGRIATQHRVNVPTLNRIDKALIIDGLSRILTFPKLSQLNIEAYECVSDLGLHPDEPILSNIDTLQIHSGIISAWMVSKIIQSAGNLKVFRHSSMPFHSDIAVERRPTSGGPSTWDMVKALGQHMQKLTTLEITKCLDLSRTAKEIIEPLRNFIQLKSLCIDAATVLGRWHCNHKAETTDPNPSTVITFADINKYPRRHPTELADCLPSGLEDLVLSINDDKSDDFILEILSGIVKQRSRLSALRRIGFYRNRASYCLECIKHGRFGIDLRLIGPAIGLDERFRESDRLLQARVAKLLVRTSLEVYLEFMYAEWPSRRDLWDSAGPCLTGESEP